MSFYMKKFFFLILVVVFVLGTGAPAAAQTPGPWHSADSVRTGLFEAQAALLGGDLEQAQARVRDAAARFEQELAPTYREHAPDAYAAVNQALTDAGAAVEAGDLDLLSQTRGQVWTGMLLGSYQMAHEAAQNGHPDEALLWLSLRDYRTSTRFSRPGADATLALQAQSRGELSAEEAAAAVRADLLDGYQVQLSKSLSDLADAHTRGLDIRRAEGAGLARGYWRLLAGAYEEQHGSAARAEMDARFDALLLTPAINAPDVALASLEAIETELQGFRAAPLSEDELARRAGQLLRFIALVPVEYGRGVKNGQVFVDLEVQEAVTFMGGAQLAFADLRQALDEIDPAGAAEIKVQMDTIEDHLTAANRREAVADPGEISAAVAGLNQSLETMLPAEWQEIDTGADFDVVATMLDQIEAAVAAGDYALAESTRLETYAVFDFGVEPRLLAFAPETAARIDGLFWQGYESQAGLSQVISRQASLKEVKAVRAELDATLNEAQLVLGDRPTTPAAIIGNAAIIVFREGLEAVVILAALVASMVGASARYRKPIALGALLALAATAVTWLLSQEVLASLSQFGERLEAVVSLIAIAVLLLITNWFFHKSYWNDWMASFHQQKRQLINRETGQFIGLVMLGFTSIYREGFETVLFLQALVLDSSPVIVLEGVAIGMVFVLLVGLITFSLNVRLPYRQMLVVTGVLIGGVLVTMVGHTVHVMQAVGWLPITPIGGVVFPYWAGLWFGFFPTWQGIVLQIFAAVFVLGSYFGAEYLKKRRREQRKHADAHLQEAEAGGLSYAKRELRSNQ
jgi:high-affinity iron transporter